jgi:hypothetical protein
VLLGQEASPSMHGSSIPSGSEWRITNHLPELRVGAVGPGLGTAHRVTAAAAEVPLNQGVLALLGAWCAKPEGKRKWTERCLWIW